jgi:hypothetical protein
MQTIDSIMTSIENKVINNEPVSAAYWCEAAIRINALIGDLDNRIAKYEAEILHIEAEFIKDDMPASKAKILAKDSIDYRDYLELKAKREKVSEFIMLAKKRAMINEL